jgi:hypothetical protein
MSDEPTRHLIRPWLAEFSAPDRERAFRAYETRAAKRGISLAVAVIVLGDLTSAWFEWQLSSARVPEHVGHLMAVRASVLVAAAVLAAGMRWWPRPSPMAWTLFGLCGVVAIMQVTSY